MFTAPTQLTSFSALSYNRRANPNPSRRRVPVLAAAVASRAPAAPPASSLYDVLGLPSGASAMEIKAAYRKLARSCHPDVVSVECRETSADRFMRVHDAYSTLSDPAKRAEYDRLLLHRLVTIRARSFGASTAPGQPSASTTPSYSGLRRRTWETDQCW